MEREGKSEEWDREKKMLLRINLIEISLEIFLGGICECLVSIWNWTWLDMVYEQREGRREGGKRCGEKKRNTGKQNEKRRCEENMQ